MLLQVRVVRVCVRVCMPIGRNKPSSWKFQWRRFIKIKSQSAKWTLHHKHVTLTSGKWQACSQYQVALKDINCDCLFCSHVLCVCVSASVRIICLMPHCFKCNIFHLTQRHACKMSWNTPSRRAGDKYKYICKRTFFCLYMRQKVMLHCIAMSLAVFALRWVTTTVAALTTNNNAVAATCHKRTASSMSFEMLQQGLLLLFLLLLLLPC